jgi:HEAT repeat protein
MTWQVVIAHARGEEAFADKLAAPLREAGYDVVHEGTVLVGESVPEEISRALSAGGPVVLCGTIRAMGTGWARRIANAVTTYAGVRLFPVRMEEDADVQQLSFDRKIGDYWRDPARATADLLAALKEYYPLGDDSRDAALTIDAENRYRRLALESCDIVDLANLPEDQQIARRHLELRRIYVPLRVRVELASGSQVGETQLLAIEKSREARLRALQEEPALVERVAVGDRLRTSRRLVILGDPGSGKSTLVRWIATAYLLRLNRDPDWESLPDVRTLPEEDWLPVVIRCRDLDAACLHGALDDILQHTLRKSEMSVPEAEGLRLLLRERLLGGRALLLIDGLDEITDPMVRARFCEQIEQITIAYPHAPILVTSRIVGYREMGQRIGREFEHATVADFSREEKDEFARRWIDLTELPERRDTAARELIRDIHSSDRIERLTGNPMLLTTLALVKRKVGKLPRRRADLYWEAVQVLLNWRSEVDVPIDHHEAVPQLEYVAYSMCERGVQRLREDEIVSLLDRMRDEYPQLHDVHRHSAREFLRLLERRTAILVEAGRESHLGMMMPVFEFRHLTFQEYLAARALVDRCFPGHDRSRSLAEDIAPLAALAAAGTGSETAPGNDAWNEALRLCVTCCAAYDVDDVLRAILLPLPGEDSASTSAGRVVLAALCLSDEPNASEQFAAEILRRLVALPGSAVSTSQELYLRLYLAISGIAATRWRETLQRGVVTNFIMDREGRWDDTLPANSSAFSEELPQEVDRLNDLLESHMQRIQSSSREESMAGLFETLEFMNDLVISRIVPSDFPKELIDKMPENAINEVIVSALSRMNVGKPEAAIAVHIINVAAIGSNYIRQHTLSKEAREAVEALIARLADEDARVRGAAASALGALKAREAVEALIARLADEDEEVRTAVAWALRELKAREAVEALIARLADEDGGVREAVAWALRELKAREAVEALIARLGDEDARVRRAAVSALGQIGGKRSISVLERSLSADDQNTRRAAVEALALRLSARDRQLLSRDLDGLWPFLDPREAVDEQRVQVAAAELKLAPEEVRRRYEDLAPRFALRLAWREQHELERPSLSGSDLR